MTLILQVNQYFHPKKKLALKHQPSDQTEMHASRDSQKRPLFMRG